MPRIACTSSRFLTSRRVNASLVQNATKPIGSSSNDDAQPCVSFQMQSWLGKFITNIRLLPKLQIGRVGERRVIFSLTSLDNCQGGDKIGYENYTAALCLKLLHWFPNGESGELPLWTRPTGCRIGQGNNQSLHSGQPRS